MMSGKPVVRGLRFPVGDILEMLASGMNESQILEQHPILEKEDIQALGSTPEEYAKYIRSELARWTKVIQTAGIKPE